MIRSIVIIILFITFSGNALAQDNEAFAERYLEQGLKFLEQSNKDAGFQDLRTVVSSFPGSPEAPEALWQMSEFLHTKDDHKARVSLLEELISKYPATLQAAAANVELGAILLQSKDCHDREKARSNFSRVISVFPETSAADSAHIELAHLLLLENRYHDAEIELTKVLIRRGEGNAGRRALKAFAKVYVLENAHIKAMSALQKLLVMVNSEQEKQALLADIQVLKRLYLSKNRPVFRDKHFTILNSNIKKPVDLCFTSEGRLLVLDLRKAIFSINPQNHRDRFIVTSNDALIHIGHGPGNSILFLTENQIRTDDKLIRPSGIPPFKKLESAAWCLPGEFWVMDRSLDGIIKLDADGHFLGRKLELSADGDEVICPVPTGGTWVLSPDQKCVFIYDHNGELSGKLKSAGAGYNLLQPIDIAVDQFGHMYILDKKLKNIMVFNSNLHKIAEFKLTKYGITSPLSMAVAPDGSLFIADKKKHDIIKLY